MSRERHTDWIGQSQVALGALLAKVKDARMRKEDVWIEPKGRP